MFKNLQRKMDLNDNILITGGAGYIGSHTNKELSQKGLNTIIIDNLVYGHPEFVKWGKFIEGDLNDPDFIRSVFASFSIKAVIHFAAFAYVGESVHEPEKYYSNNVINTLNLLQVMREFGVSQIVFSSTCATYGLPKATPITEDHPQQPINPYGKSKLMVEQVLEDYSNAYGLKHASLRYFNAAGADPDGETGEWHEPETHLIPLVFDVALGKKSKLKFLEQIMIPQTVHVFETISMSLIWLMHIYWHLIILKEKILTSFVTLETEMGIQSRK